MTDWPVLIREVSLRFDRGEGFALATLNLDHVAKLRDNSAFRAAYADHDLVVADGNPVVWLSWLARKPVSLVPGADLVVPLTRLAADRGLPVALVGSTQDVLATAARRLEEDVTGASVVEAIAPSMKFDPDGPEADAIIDAIDRSGARLCFVALGAPKQERFSARARKRAPQIGFASVGAGIDFIAGRQRRAPVWMRQFAMEWAWRLVWDPVRLAPRYLRCAMILPEQVGSALSARSDARRA